jgi:citrate lyase subunit beta/citryl-CoA lyase
MSDDTAKFRPLRSALYMPATHVRALEKAKTLPADAVIFDLEDSVAPDLKVEARRLACDAARSGDYGDRTIVIRINGFATPWGEDDLKDAIQAAPDAILAPKIKCGGDAMVLSRTMESSGAPETLLWVMIETPLAILNIAEIAATSMHPETRLSCFVIGTNDLAKETSARITPGRASVVPHLAQCVCAARAYGLSILDGVCNQYDDETGLRAECLQGLELGMDGKTLIHPDQIGICNQVFSPTSQELDWARRIVAEFDRPENVTVNVLSIDGHMVERLHADMARRTIAIAEAIGAEAIGAETAAKI